MRKTLSDYFILLAVVFALPVKALTLTGSDLEAQITAAIGANAPVTIQLADYIVDTPIQINLPTGQNLNIVFLNGTVIHGGTSSVQMNGPILTIQGTSSTTHALKIAGRAVIQCVNCSNGVSSQGGTGLSLIDMYSANVSGIKFLAGQDGDGNGDSGITSVNVTRLDFRYNEFVGWDDVGVYISGDQSEDGLNPSQSAMVYSNLFKDNHNALSSKRRYRYVRAEKNVFERNFVDLSVLPAGNNGTGKMIYALDNTFRETRRNVVDARGDYLAGTPYNDEDWIEIRMQTNKICRPFAYVQEPGAAIYSSRSQTGEGRINSYSNRIDQRFLNGAPVHYEHPSNPQQTIFSSGDLLLNGC